MKCYNMMCGSTSELFLKLSRPLKMAATILDPQITLSDVGIILIHKRFQSLKLFAWGFFMVTLIVPEFISPYLDESTAIFVTNINYLASSSSLVSQLIICVVTICKIQLLYLIWRHLNQLNKCREAGKYRCMLRSAHKKNYGHFC